jgi:hypothetical protein
VLPLTFLIPFDAEPCVLTSLRVVNKFPDILDTANLVFQRHSLPKEMYEGRV